MKKSNIIRAYTCDGLMTFDQRTIDSAGAFLVGELERLDQNLHAPLAAVTWNRDIDLREDVSVADEFSSFTNSSFAAASGTGLSGKAWIGKEANAITGIGLDISKTAQALSLWGMQLGWTLPELESAQKLGRPVDQQKTQRGPSQPQNQGHARVPWPCVPGLAADFPVTPAADGSCHIRAASAPLSAAVVKDGPCRKTRRPETASRPSAPSTQWRRRAFRPPGAAG